MSIKVALEHRTTYRFDRPVKIFPHTVRLRPAPHSRTYIESYSLQVSPSEHFLNWQQDPFGNWLARLVFPEPATELDITVGVVADMKVINPFDFFVEEYAERYPFQYDADLRRDLALYLEPVVEPGHDQPGPGVREWMRGLPPVPEDGLRIVDFLVQVNTAVYRDVAYSVRMEPGVQSPDQTLERAIGSCRDSAWLLVSVLRQLGLAARFVSGYLVQLSSDVQAIEGPSGPAQDFTDLHAWAEVFIPGAGWIGLDPTSALFAGEGHIPLFCSPHAEAAAPISGATGVCEVEFSFSNTVTRVHEDPRVTLPYSEAQWAKVDAVGERVDELLRERDVRLTMGGEPTFIAVDDMVSGQWTTEADGEDKRDRATVLAGRLQERYGKGGIVHRGQGKWYPGEPLPRWQIALTWRKDDDPLWTDPGLLADPWDDDQRRDDAPDAAAALTRAVLRGFGLPESQGIPAYEDALLALHADLRRPDGPRPDDDADPAQPDREVDEQLHAGAEPAAWVIPIHPAQDGDGWASPAWRFRRGRLVLVPGDSPAGLRLPLDSVDWKDPDLEAEPSYLEPTGELKAARRLKTRIISPEGARRTALAVEARGGFVYVFLPPLTELADFVALISLIERSAKNTGTPVVLEGYPPPPDTRLETLMVTPDPGVIEVNLQPTGSWPALRELTTTLYEQARLSRLATEKFDLDGTHTGTGGGNHITLGGPTPKDSPLLRRPDLLVSMLTCWQRHPSLSYLFSGRFVGPTSQAPRVDEGRPEMLYELEIAMAEIERLSSHNWHFPPWIVDRALRHILTDITGNTHRAEFCIDKLYSPDSARGRLGLLELRGFEMPPHPQMALVQALLVRSLVAMFWQRPYSQPLVRWGTTLHEKFLLPHYCGEDIAEVVAMLRAHGIEFDLSWLGPFMEFRFPRIGSTQVGEVSLELRTAIEPWHVLGEESTSGGTARYVDSSVERMQVKVENWTPGRQVLLCNGVPVPLAATATTGTHVAGIRFRAWQPWSALHPTIKVDGPLVFDIVDLDNRRSLGGARYHVSHPGGRSYDTPPVNAMEAESRRWSRFETIAHSTGDIDVEAVRERMAWVQASNREYPHTLDMRRRTPRTWGRL
ncbi:DUF2126 domain-containing protein [Blastococcus sp. Marseille-P5729]|uniref:transglutaminase family protein n=1 Tax=Blastococcus sp. Marseille-P5729 TaxID=2086582 RepID=UPI000D0F7BF5|nr:transglutaminase family protein [Blastococcus sp. Marseille-P5729]